MSTVETESCSSGNFGGLGFGFFKKLKEFLGQKINVEFECGDCCKRVTGGTLEEVGFDFIQLSGNINIIIFIPGVTQPVIKKACTVVIPIGRICDIEKP